MEAVLAECQELIEQFKRQPSRAGYKDIILTKSGHQKKETKKKKKPFRRGLP